MNAKSSQRLLGLGASPGIAVGPAFVLERKRPRTPRRPIDEAELPLELARLEEALRAADEQLVRTRQRLDGHEGAEYLLILEAHRLMLRDPAFADEAKRLIRDQRFNAEWAVRRAARHLRRAFGSLEDAYFRERWQDVDFVADRVIRNLTGQGAELGETEVPAGCVLVARDLSPADAMTLLIPGKILGLVTERGTRTSHTAIVAHSRCVPAVVGVDGMAALVAAGEVVALERESGRVVLRCGEDELARFAADRERLAGSEGRLVQERSLPAATTDGHLLSLRANIEEEEEIPRALEVGAQGVGLYRTEFLYLGRKRLPTEDEHYRTYHRILERMEGQPVTIRTMDLGADKLPAALGRRAPEPNPALGLRALRLGMRHPEVLQAQLRGILRASVHGEVRLLFPMISGIDELHAALAAWEEARATLDEEGLPYDPEIPVGVMIELPSAVQTADRLARRVDFFAIGTNDLIQYALAMDRQNAGLAFLYRPLHLSVLRMVQATVAAARGAGIPVSVCGEMASEPKHALVLLGLGVDELSMTAGAIPLVRRLVRSVSAEEARRLVAEALALDTAKEIEALVDRAMEPYEAMFEALPEEC